MGRDEYNEFRSYRIYPAYIVRIVRKGAASQFDQLQNKSWVVSLFMIAFLSLSLSVPRAWYPSALFSISPYPVGTKLFEKHTKFLYSSSRNNDCSESKAKARNYKISKAISIKYRTTGYTYNYDGSPTETSENMLSSVSRDTRVSTYYILRLFLLLFVRTSAHVRE